jgi:hypothetical protein
MGEGGQVAFELVAEGSRNDADSKVYVCDGACAGRSTRLAVVADDEAPGHWAGMKLTLNPHPLKKQTPKGAAPKFVAALYV